MTPAARKTVLVKVCGLTRRQDVDACLQLGVDLLGFIFHPSSPRNVDPAFPASIRDPGALKVGVFVKQSVDQVLRIMDQAGLDLAQLHGGQDLDFCRTVGPDRVIKVLWPERCADPEELQKEADRFGSVCSRLLLDAGLSGGGHGRPLDALRIGQMTPKTPWMLAGGLGPDNVAQAVAQLNPSAVDLNSGVESAPGAKDIDKLRAALEALRAR
ncbi:MAG: phosphoribosylanthranilate isomerase [Desulfovibrionaceae bacterium]